MKWDLIRKKRAEMQANLDNLIKGNLMHTLWAKQARVYRVLSAIAGLFKVAVKKDRIQKKKMMLVMRCSALFLCTTKKHGGFER